MVNVKNFGAVANGTTDDTFSIANAISHSLSTKEPLYFPAGDYLITQKLNISYSSFSICGDGKALSRLIWDCDGGGIEFTGSSNSSANDINTFSIRDISLSTKRNSKSGTALRIQFPVMLANPQKKIIIKNIEIRGFDQYQNINSPSGFSWQNGIWISNPGGLDISHTDILGNTNFAKSGIKCESPANSSPIRHFLSNLYILYHENGLEWNGPHEGVYFNNFEIVGCEIGFKAYGGGTVYHLTNGHIDARMSGCSFAGQNEVKLSNIAFFHTNNGGTRLAGNIILMKECNRFLISNCSFYGFYPDININSVIHQNGILAEKCNKGLITNNLFDQIKDTAILMGADTVNCHAAANLIDSCWADFIDNGNLNTNHPI